MVSSPSLPGTPPVSATTASHPGNSPSPAQLVILLLGLKELLDWKDFPTVNYNNSLDKSLSLPYRSGYFDLQIYNDF